MRSQFVPSSSTHSPWSSFHRVFCKRFASAWNCFLQHSCSSLYTCLRILLIPAQISLFKEAGPQFFNEVKSPLFVLLYGFLLTGLYVSHAASPPGKPSPPISSRSKHSHPPRSILNSLFHQPLQLDTLLF